MPSKKKAKGKARRAAKSRKAKEDEGVVNGIDSEMQRLHIDRNENSKDDEEALLEAAINLATAEREELEAAAKSDEVNNSEECYHGFVPWPRGHVCGSFFESFFDNYNACCKSDPFMSDLFAQVYEATKTTYAEVWNDLDKVQWIASHFIHLATNEILEENYRDARIDAMCSFFFEQWATLMVHENGTQTCNWGSFVTLCDWTKMSELYDGDEHTLVSFCRKRIPCKCLDKKYKEVKWITKIGFCCYEDCTLPGNKTVRSKMLYCSQCRNANYCSRECQVAHWPSHKEICAVAANMLTARKLRQKK